MKAILPAAGYATRMYPLTENFPKSLLRIDGRPVIEYPISKIQKSGCVDEVIIVTNDRYYERFLEWQRGFSSALEIRVINDKTKCNEERIGSVGDIALALEQGNVSEDFLVVNPDNLFTFDLGRMYRDFQKRRKSVIALFDVGTIEQAKKLGNPVTNSDCKVISFKEKNPDAGSTICTIGIYFFTQEIRDRIFEYLRECSCDKDRFGSFIEWLHRKEDLYGHLYNGNNRWFDIGSRESYEKAKEIKDIETFL